MFKVYIIKNSDTGRRYIGYSADLNRRLEEHNRGQTKSTALKGIWKLIHLETYPTEIEAKNREKKLKSFKGGNGLKKLIKPG